MKELISAILIIACGLGATIGAQAGIGAPPFDSTARDAAAAAQSTANAAAINSTNAINLTGSGAVSNTATGGAALTPVALAQGTHGYTLSAETATTSGTSKDFTGIPSWATIIYVHFNGFSTIGTSIPIIQIGTSGVPDITGYLATGTTFGASTLTSASATTGIPVEGLGGASNVRSGTVVIRLESISSNRWLITSTMNRNDTIGVLIGAGIKSLGGALSIVRVTTVNGTDTFDLGAVSIAYE